MAKTGDWVVLKGDPSKTKMVVDEVRADGHFQVTDIPGAWFTDSEVEIVKKSANACRNSVVANALNATYKLSSTEAKVGDRVKVAGALGTYIVTRVDGEWIEIKDADDGTPQGRVEARFATLAKNSEVACNIGGDTYTVEFNNGMVVKTEAHNEDEARFNMERLSAKFGGIRAVTKNSATVANADIGKLLLAAIGACRALAQEAKAQGNVDEYNRAVKAGTILYGMKPAW